MACSVPQVIVRVLQHLAWDYVVVVYTDSSYGRGAYTEVRARLAESDVCLTAAIAIPPADTDDATMDGVLNQVLATETTGVIYLGTPGQADSLLRRAESYPRAGLLQWIFTDSLSLSDTFPGQTYPRGVLAVVPGSRKITEFEDHWVRIDPTAPSAENPWFQDQYMRVHRCRLPGVTYPPYATYADCAELSENSRRMNFVQDMFVEPAVHAVFAYAHALRAAHQTLCSGQPGLCAQLKSLSNADFYQQYLRQTNFVYGKAERVESLASAQLEPYYAPAKVEFDGNDIVGSVYDIYNFNDYANPGTFRWTKVGAARWRRFIIIKVLFESKVVNTNRT
jgi:hypothetical protein